MFSVAFLLELNACVFTNIEYHKNNNRYFLKKVGYCLKNIGY